MIRPEYEQRIGKVTSTFLGLEDHGIWTAYLHMDYGGSGQGVGGYTLDEPVHEGESFKGRVGSAYGMEWIRRTTKACGVNSWERVAGCTIYVLFPLDAGWNETPVGIENLPTEKGERFLFSELREQFFGVEKSA